MKRSAPYLVAVMLCSLALCSYAHSAEPIRVAVPDISNLLNENQTGVYQKIMQRALKTLDTDIQEAFYPYKRTRLVFEQARADCIYSFTEVLKDRLGDDAVIASFPLGRFSYHLFSLKDKEPPTSLDALEGKRVGIVIGHEAYLSPIIEGRNIDVIWTRHEALNVAMLEHGRFDTMIAAIPDIRPYLDKLSYAREYSLLESYDRLTCHNTERNRVFLKALSAELRRLKKAGYYQEIAGPLFVDFDE
jgi:hypothetical protein